MQLSIEHERAERRKVMVRQLTELAKDLLQEDARTVDSGPTHGVTFDQVRICAETRGLLTGEEKGRTLSFGAAVMKGAGGVPCEYRPSRHRNSHGRAVRVFRLATVASG